MTLSNAAIEGISANGLNWRHTGPRIKTPNAVLADLNDNGVNDESDAQRLTDASHKIAAAIRLWLNGITSKEKKSTSEINILEDFEHRHEDELVFMEDIDTVSEVNDGIYNDPQEVLNEINYIMNNIYDSFDYHRILVQ